MSLWLDDPVRSRNNSEDFPPGSERLSPGDVRPLPHIDARIDPQPEQELPATVEDPPVTQNLPCGAGVVCNIPSGPENVFAWKRATIVAESSSENMFRGRAPFTANLPSFPWDFYIWGDDAPRKGESESKR